MMLLSTHPRAIGIEEWDGADDRGTAIADDLDLEPVARCGKLRGNIAERHGFLHVVSITARGDPAHGLAGMPDRLVADAVGIVGTHHESGETPLRTVIFFLQSGVAADEVVLAQLDEPSQAGFGGSIDRPVLARPATE